MGLCFEKFYFTLVYFSIIQGLISEIIPKVFPLEPTISWNTG